MRFTKTIPLAALLVLAGSIPAQAEILWLMGPLSDNQVIAAVAVDRNLKEVSLRFGKDSLIFKKGDFETGLPMVSAVGKTLHLVQYHSKNGMNYVDRFWIE